jgi:hypothetical protein
VVYSIGSEIWLIGQSFERNIGVNDEKVVRLPSSPRFSHFHPRNSPSSTALFRKAMLAGSSLILFSHFLPNLQKVRSHSFRPSTLHRGIVNCAVARFAQEAGSTFAFPMSVAVPAVPVSTSELPSSQLQRLEDEV